MQACIKRSSNNMKKITKVNEHNRRELQQIQLLKRNGSVASLVRHVHCCLLGWRALLQQHPQIFACPDMNSHTSGRMKIAEQKRMFC